MTREDIKNKTLHLVLKGNWYDMIASGEKKEEYREIKPYWVNRLLRIRRDFAYDFDTYSDCISMLENETEHAMNVMDAAYTDYDYVCFHRGYTNTTMTFELKDINIGIGNPEWGAPTDRPVFIIKLGERL